MTLSLAPMAAEADTPPPTYVAPAPTNEPLDYADLAIINLSKANTSEGRLELSSQVVQAMKTHGFFYVINHGYTSEQRAPEEIDLDYIANVTFDSVSDDEKSQYMEESASVYEGYKPQKTWLIDGGIQDSIEHYNINRHLYKRAHPVPLRPYLARIDDFAKHNHYNVLHPILRLLALGLELPEDALVNKHRYDSPGHTSVRFMKYYPRPLEEETNTKNVWLKGHTDIGSITILWSQPISGLQVLSLDGKWQWVINAGDAMEFLGGKFYPATRHRVIQPPADQRGVPRLGVFYFAMPDDDAKLVPFEDSPVLQKVGITYMCDPSDAPTMEEWRKNRTKTYGKVALKQGAENGVEEELVNGVVVKHYN
ncbi:hypothetical protein H0H92_007801 [Tricholoma furcatifolium]|nr:hypothetical protein H0H92_007801 [Tricholoma furcatifolium]